MIQIGDISDIIEQWAPLSTAEAWDNVGLMHGNKSDRVETIVIALDLTLPLIDRIGDHPHPLVITHHPPIFKPLKNLVEDTYAVKTVCEAVRRSVALYAAHTNLDKAPHGVSHALAEKLGLKAIEPLGSGGGFVKFVTFIPPAHVDSVRDAAAEAGAGITGEYSHCSFMTKGTGTFIPSGKASPFAGSAGKLSRDEEIRLEMIVPIQFSRQVVDAARKAHPYEEMAYDLLTLSNEGGLYGYGALGRLEYPMDAPRFVQHIAQALGIRSVQTSKAPDSRIGKVAVLGGSGGGFIGLAETSGADAYVSAEFSHHDYIDHGDAVFLVDAGHRATELPVLSSIRDRLLQSGALDKCSILVETGDEICYSHEYNT